MAGQRKPISEQVVAITGASSGIGLITARQLARAGASVMLIARTEDALRQAVRDIERDGGSADYAVADVGDAEQVNAAVAKTVMRFGRIDTWVNNAGTAIYARLEDTPLAEHERLFRTNYFGVVNCSLAALPHLRASHGTLITVASIAADIPSPILSAYSASKHAVKGFIESLRMELIADHAPVAVTLIKPSGMDTPLAKRAAQHIPGHAVIPPPVYDPATVARAIMDAAARPRRTITVGGLGKAQVVVGALFPQLLDHMSGAVTSVLSEHGSPQPGTHALDAPIRAGEERSGEHSGRTISLYAAARRHPLATATIAVGAALAIRAALRRR